VERGKISWGVDDDDVTYVYDDVTYVYDDVTDVFSAVERGKVSWGVAPVENSTEGGVYVVL
jgi:prephenate dehydratase